MPLIQLYSLKRNVINAGALVVTDTLLGDQAVEHCSAGLLTMVQSLADDSSIKIDEVVAQSERDTAYRNASLAHFMQSFGNLKRPVSDVLDIYCQQCAIAMSCEQLARSVLFLANNGTDPLTKEVIVNEERARRLNALMMLCGVWSPCLNANGNSHAGTAALEALVRATTWNVL